MKPDGSAVLLVGSGVFFVLFLRDIRVFSQIKGEDTLLLKNTEWTLDLAFVTDITVKSNHLNCELEGKGKPIADMMSALNAF